MHYFAYGSNLLSARLRERVGRASRREVARLEGHALRFHKRGQDGSGKAGVFVAGAEDAVWGVLFEIDPARRADLDRVEGLGRGYAVEQRALTTPSGVLRAFLYVAEPDHVDATLAPFAWYRDLVVAGAREHGFPRDYVTRLAAEPAVEDPDAERAARNRALLGR